MITTRTPGRVIALAAALVWTGPASAHDFWVQPQRFWVAPSDPVATSVQVGHGGRRAAWPVKVARVLDFRSVGPEGASDHRHRLRQGGTEVPLSFPLAGTYVLAMQTNHADSVLPGPRFNAYLEEEGLTPALELRRRTGRTQTPGRELYSRRAKALVQVGPLTGSQLHVTRPLGLTLEIVPERNPYALKTGEALPVRVVFEGEPLAGALVKFTDLSADAEPVAQQRTDGAGRTTFKAPGSGEWLLSVVWTKPVKHPKADFDTTFASLTFGFSGGDERR
jgi:uncharacterized GH25 family protein